MRCSKCNREIDDVSGRCTYCDEKEAVRVISKEEVTGYQGVTIDTDAEERQRQYRGGREQRVFVKKINIGSRDWLTKLLAVVIFAALAAFLLFVALPVALIGIGVGVVVWLVLSFLRG